MIHKYRGWINTEIYTEGELLCTLRYQPTLLESLLNFVRLKSLAFDNYEISPAIYITIVIDKSINIDRLLKATIDTYELEALVNGSVNIKL